MRRRWQTVDGVLLLDKPLGISSNDALQKARRCFQAAKAGHTGTLDPLATGLLPVLFGEATKFSHVLLDADKTYLARVRLGETTTTGDAEGECLLARPVLSSSAQLAAACADFLGDISQLPPMHSALKHQGKALYEYARQGIEIAREPRQVTIHSIEIVSMNLPPEPGPAEFECVVCCSKGTYIRTLAEDIGEALGCGAHLVGLRRVATGPLSIAQAVSLERLQSALTADEDISAYLLPPDSLLSHLPELRLPADAARRFLHGQSIPFKAEIGQVRVYVETAFLGLAEMTEDEVLKPVRLIAQDQRAE